MKPQTSTPTYDPSKAFMGKPGPLIPPKVPGLAGAATLVLGQKAKSPEQNVKSTSPALPANQAQAAPIPPAPQPAAVGYSSWPGGEYTATPQPSYSGPPMTNGIPGGLYGQLIGKLANFGLSPQQQEAYNLQANLETGLAAGKNVIMRQPIALEFQQGRAAALNRDFVPQIDAANKMLELANKQREMELSGLGTAAGLAAPVQVPFTSQFLDPVSGGYIGAGGNPVMMQIPDYARQVVNGQKTFDQAAGELGNNPYFTSLLNQAIQGFNSGFNTTGSNTIGSQQYQSLLNSFNTVQQHMQDAMLSIQKLPLTSFPIINAAIAGGLQQLGSPEYQQYKTIIGTLQSEIANVLGGGQATDMARTEAKDILPDNIGPDQLAAALEKAKKLMEEKIKQYGSLGGGYTTVQGGAQHPYGGFGGGQESAGWF